ncbi:MAG: sigma-70 family RNA polymerase sigma factor [Planctomycetota bacterium]|nr:MAG: sigma-70 family RNA polymerase sigma factor [Planctomycetota bacterium]
MNRLDYDGLVESWKVDLIISRAKRMGFRCDEMEDLQQELILDVMHFRYDTAKSNGATETTALIALIDNRLKKLRRSETRYRAHLERLAVERKRAYASTPSECWVNDVREAVEFLPMREYMVCCLLGRGYSKLQIANALGCGWHTVDRLMRRIRKHLLALGLDETAHD